jgi:hypothetical protein
MDIEFARKLFVDQGYCHENKTDEEVMYLLDNTLVGVSLKLRASLKEVKRNIRLALIDNFIWFKNTVNAIVLKYNK